MIIIKSLFTLNINYSIEHHYSKASPYYTVLQRIENQYLINLIEIN